MILSFMNSSDVIPVHLVHVSPERNMARYYGIRVQPTLFGDVCVLRSWGRIGTKGRSMMMTFDDADKAAAALLKLETQKRRRGYVSVPVLNPVLNPV